MDPISPRPDPSDAGGAIPLSGGNVTSAVVRIGNTVRRPAGPSTPAVHALLTHLLSVGFTAAPRPLGIDERGRQVLSYAPGVVAWPDHFDLLADDAALRRMARLVRDLHDAASSFVPPPDAAWQVAMPAPTAELIVHNDIAPWNLVIGERGWVLIDWDGASPGSRLWDLAYAFHGFLPLTATAGTGGLPSQAHRLRVFADAYAMDGAQRKALVPLLAQRTMAYRTAIDNLEDTSFGLYCGVGRLIENAPHVTVVLRRPVAVVHSRALVVAGA